MIQIAEIVTVTQEMNEVDELLLVDTEIEERLRDPTINMCDYCVTMYVKEVPPKRPLSPFIFFSQE